MAKSDKPKPDKPKAGACPSCGVGKFKKVSEHGRTCDKCDNCGYINSTTVKHDAEK